MQDLKTLRKEQQHKLAEIETNIAEREQELGKLSSRMKYAEEYFESLEQSIERMNESLHEIEIQENEAKTAQGLKFEIDELKHELSTATERCAIRDQEKDKTIQDLRNNLEQKEVSIRMSRAKIGKLEEKTKKFVRLNQELADIKKMHEGQKTNSETLISELKVVNLELSEKYEKITGENKELLENMEALSRKAVEVAEEMKIDSGFPWLEHISKIGNKINTFNAKTAKHSALYLVPPHAELIWTEVKTTIIKSKKFEAHIGEPLYLISDKQCWGVIKLSEPKEIDKKIFKETYKDHLIEEHERIEWWDQKFPLFSYGVEIVEKYDQPKKVEISTGIQVFIKPESITFTGGEDG